MSEFTPGPWRVVGHTEVGPIHRFVIASETLGIIDADYEADAHLIAAAPELYARLAALRNRFLGTKWMDGVEYEGHITPGDRIDALLAKARGEA